MDTGLILIACGFVGLAIAVSLFSRSSSDSDRSGSWLTRDLYRGDLSALTQLVRGASFDVTYDQIGRLKKRGFVRSNFFGTFSVTFKGYIALIVRKTFNRNQSLPTEFN